MCNGLSKLRTEALGFAVGAIIAILVVGSVTVNYYNTISDLRTQEAADNDTIQSLLLQRFLIFSSSNFPYSNYSFLSPPAQDCYNYEEVCFKSDPDTSVVFNCAAAAASPSGCTQLVADANGQGVYFVNIKYPVVLGGTRFIGLGCTFTILANGTIAGYNYTTNASCIPTNATAFVVGISTPGPV